MKGNNIRRIDTHLHTIFSDGKLSIQQLIQRCKKNNVKVMAITDHDTVKGVINWGKNDNNDITVIPGIELSAYSQIYPQIHITGYFPRTTNFEQIEEYLSNHVKEIRVNRCRKILEKLHEDGISIPYSAIEEKAKNRYPSLPIIAECLLEFKYTTYLREAYDKYIGSDCKYYEPVRLFTVKEAIDFIHLHSGLACLAHPWLCKNPMEVCMEALQLNIDGIECFPPKHHELHGDVMFAVFVKENHLFASSGSDFHYEENCEVDVGENYFPEEYADQFLHIMKQYNII